MSDRTAYEKLIEAINVKDHRIASLEADLKRVLDKYDDENPARLADYHLTGCDCMRCRVDDARATLQNSN
jgi:hypothetical protein